jgi:integrase
MSESNPIAPADPVKPAKPAPDFPLFPHATRRWAKKIKGKMHYFGRWDDPEGALREYQEFVAGSGKDRPRQRPADPAKPAKPYPEYPLFAHAGGVWAKKIRGKLHYFGPWNDPDGALAKYEEQKEALHSGKKPRPTAGEGVTVKDVVNKFLNAKDALVEAGELSPLTRAKHQTAGELAVSQLGKGRLVSDLDPSDFAALRQVMARRWGVYRLGDMIQQVRSIFRHAYEAELIPAPVRFGPGFARPTKKVVRLHKAKQGPKLFTADQVRQMIAKATPNLKAMLLLGINCGFGNSDCATLPLAGLDLEKGWVDYPRPKTGTPRRCPLWPETVAALREVLARCPNAKEKEGEGRVFLTRCGHIWSSDSHSGPLVKEFRDVLRKASIEGRKGTGFYTLRHTFRTIADEAKDQPAADFIMGHEVASMSSVYRETISDARLKAVVDHVHSWLFGG